MSKETAYRVAEDATNTDDVESSENSQSNAEARYVAQEEEQSANRGLIDGGYDAVPGEEVLLHGQPVDMLRQGGSISGEMNVHGRPSISYVPQQTAEKGRISSTGGFQSNGNPYGMKIPSLVRSNSPGQVATSGMTSTTAQYSTYNPLYSSGGAYSGTNFGQSVNSHGVNPSAAQKGYQSYTAGTSFPHSYTTGMHPPHSYATVTSSPPPYTIGSNSPHSYTAGMHPPHSYTTVTNRPQYVKTLSGSSQMPHSGQTTQYYSLAAAVQTPTYPSTTGGDTRITSLVGQQNHNELRPDAASQRSQSAYRNTSGTGTASTMITSKIHQTGSRSGRWVTSIEGTIVEDELERGAVYIVRQNIVERQFHTPKKVIREDYFEKIALEKEVSEEVIDDVQMVREKIVEYSRPQPEKIVEVPEYEYVERIVEIPEKIVQEKIREVPKIEYRERIIEVPKYITQEKIVEIPEIEYKEVTVEKIVEVPQVQEEVVIREVPVPQYIDKPYPEYVNVEEKYNVERKIPVPVEVQTTWKYELPKLKPRFSKVKVPLYVPRFTEIPVPQELMGDSLEMEANALANHVALIAQQQAISLCEVENVAAAIKNADFRSKIDSKNYSEVLRHAWVNGAFAINNSSPVSSSDAPPARRSRSGRHAQVAVSPKKNHKSSKTTRKGATKSPASNFNATNASSGVASRSPGVHHFSPKSQISDNYKPAVVALLNDIQAQRSRFSSFNRQMVPEVKAFSTT